MMKNARTLKQFCDCSGIGIDVSKASLEVVGRAGDKVWCKTVANQRRAIEGLARVLREGGYAHKVVCESTGHYHLLLGLVFAEYGLDLRIVNPLQSSKHQKSRIRKTKTDRVDGDVLAGMCESERDLPPAADLQPQGVRIRLKQGQLHALDKQLQRLTRSLGCYRETYAQLGFEEEASMVALATLVKELTALKRRMEKELNELLAAALPDSRDLARLRCLPGYSATVAGLVGTVFDRQAKSYRSWVAYAGMDVSVRESGTWRGRGKLTKRGNRYIRKRLFCAAWGAVMHYDEVHRYYDSLKANGRNHIEALCIIARKLLRIAYTVLVKNVDYDANIAFAN